MDFLSSSILCIQLLAIECVIIYLFHYFTRKRTDAGFLERFLFYLTYSLCLSAMVLLPTDLARCLLDSATECVLVNVQTRQFVSDQTPWTIMWQVYLWTLFTLAWYV